MGGKIENLTGRRFGRLAVTGEAPARVFPSGGRKRQWACRCDCGTEVVVLTGSLTKAQGTRSCGCLQRERASRANVTHGATMGRQFDPIYRIWRAMLTRCSNPKFKQFKDWGGRGIQVCARWRRDYPAFYADMGPRPDGYMLDRIDVNGGYTPENCRWASRAVSNTNKRT